MCLWRVFNLHPKIYFFFMNRADVYSWCESFIKLDLPNYINPVDCLAKAETESRTTPPPAIRPTASVNKTITARQYSRSRSSLREYVGGAPVMYPASSLFFASICKSEEGCVETGRSLSPRRKARRHRHSRSTPKNFRLGVPICEQPPLPRLPVRNFATTLANAARLQQIFDYEAKN